MLCQQVLNRPPAVIWLHGREVGAEHGNGNVLGDRTIPHWFAAHRTASWTHWSLIFTTLGATQAILIAALATCVVFLAVTRHWRLLFPRSG